MSTITVVMLNYKRPENVRRILDALSDQTVRPTIWLWNNSGQPISDSRVDMEILADANLYCWPRWFLASYATTTNVMLIDDDIIPTSDKLIEIVEGALQRQTRPETIVGAEGVVLGREKAYWPEYSGRVARETVGVTESSVHLKKVSADVHVDIVKGRCLAVRTRALKMLPLSPDYRDKCDDIAASALLAKGRRRAHVVSAALGRVLEDIPDSRPEVALSRLPNWREVRDSANGHYYNNKEAIK